MADIATLAINLFTTGDTVSVLRVPRGGESRMNVESCA